MAHNFFVRPLITKMADSLPLDGEIAFDEYGYGTLDFRVEGPARYAGSVDFVGEGVRAHGSVQIPLTATCVRCLVEFPLTVRGRFDTVFFTDPRNDSEGDPLPIITEPEDEIDLEPMLIEALVIETPFAPLHDRNCQGICPTCGVDLNNEECECDEGPDPDHPFAVLRSLIADDGGAEQPE